MMYKKLNTTLFLVLLMSMYSFRASATVQDIYIIFYASMDGETGHVGIAVDNYTIYINEGIDSNLDTVKNYTLEYFDLWGPNEIRWHECNKDLKANYYRLPQSSSEEKLSVRYFMEKGLPHKYNYPCDGIVKFSTTPKQDYELRNIVETIEKIHPFFNTRKYNCTDFVIKCLEGLLNISFVSKEFIPFEWSSTPNAFFTELVNKHDVEIIKRPKSKTNKSFFIERIIKSF